MTLTDKQTVDLNASIMEYLLHKGYKNAAAAFNNDIAEEGTETELRTPPPPTTTTAAANSNVIPLLEKKWTSIVRLSKKVADLERQLASAKSKGLTEETDPNSVTRNKSRLLPTNTILKSLEGHRGSVTCTDLHPTYTILASSSDDGTIKIWDVESGTFEKTLKGHSNAVNSVNFSHSGDLLASSSMDMSIKIWDVKQNYVCVNTLNGHEHNVSMAKFLATDSSSLVSVSRDKTVKFWDLKTGYCVNTNAFAHNDWVRCVSIRNDGELIATGSNDKSIAVFKLTDGELKKATVCLTIEAHDHHIESVAFPPKNLAKTNAEAANYLASCGRDKTTKLWNALTGDLIHCFRGHENWVRDVIIHRNGDYIITCGDDKTIRVFDIDNKRELRALEGLHKAFIGSIVMHRALPIMISGGNDSIINVVDLR